MTASTGRAERLLDHTGAFVIDDLGGAEAGNVVAVVAACRRDHVSALGGGEVDDAQSSY